MCGIIGYVGHRAAVPVIMEGLAHLEYRGYDSSGVAFIQQGRIEILRAEGKLAALQSHIAKSNLLMTSMTGIGHTRWATHGEPIERNAHPQCGGLEESPALALVHNGIIENYQILKAELMAKGYVFQSDTDTEVLAHLIAEGLKQMPTTLEGFAWALRQAHGAYAVTFICPQDGQTVYAARNASPLILGVGVGEHFVASDVPAFLAYTREVVFLQDDEIVVLTDQSWQVYALDTLKPREKAVQTITWDMQAAQKEGYKHFMLKEIYEQPRVILDCLAGRLNDDGSVCLPELDAFAVPKRLHIIACGTSYHAGLWAQHLMETWAHIPVSVEIASEFRYRNVLLDPDDMVLVISQSGETADTLAALHLVKKYACRTLALCNVMGSNIAREVDEVIYTQAGPEISVASTKAMCSQMLVLALIALYYGKAKGSMDIKDIAKTTKALQDISKTLEEALPSMQEQAKKYAQEFATSKSFFYLGRGHAFPLALEGALKLKELSYIHAEGYASGEMKHGPIALIDAEFPSFALLFDDELFPKNYSNILEVIARRGRVLVLTDADTASLNVGTALVWRIPSVKNFLIAFVALPALQLFSYEMAEYLGKDVDQPRNLAKSVTVE